MENSLINELTKTRLATEENWQTTIEECLSLMLKAAEEIATLKNNVVNLDKCKLLLIPYGADEGINIAFEGSCSQITEFVRKYEQDPETSKRCSFVAIAGDVLPATKWAPIDQVSYEPLIRTTS